MAVRIAACAIGVAAAAWSIAGVAGAYSTASLTPQASFLPQARPLRHAEAPVDPKTFAFRLAKIAPQVDQQGKTVRPKPKPVMPVVTAAATAAPDPFARAVLQARLSPDSVRSAFAQAGLEIVVPEDRFAKVVREANVSPEMVREAFAQFGEIETAPAEVQVASLEPRPDETLATAVDVFAVPDSAPLPEGRPARAAAADKPAAVAAAVPPAAATPEKPAKPGRATRKPAAEEAPQALAYARPDKPKGGVAGAFKDLFNAPRSPAGAGVAVYDISAATVYMPDGTRLEAHSGIGKMADNPRYAHVKMNGPTPPHVYNLRMRESRFHGVEAIRMLPVDGKNKFGRDGFLTHSYLLRGGREESHGCVAFANYPKFLKAFKQGKVKQLVVVPSISGTRYASLGRGA